MRVHHSLKILTALSLGFLVFGPSHAEAQLGIGIGVGRGGYWGPGYYGPGFYGPGFGSFFGLGLGLSPRFQGRQSDARVNRLGSLKGNINLCPAEQRRTSCSAPYEVLQNMVISAIPHGGNQWISTRPNAEGEYRLQLSPGRYLVRVDTPDTFRLPRSPSEVRIEAGRTRHLDLKLQDVQK